MLLRQFTSLAAILVLWACLALQSAFAAPSKPIGPDIEDYNPPYANDAAVLAWQSAYASGDQVAAERLARARLAIVQRNRPRDVFAILEARFMLGVTLNASGRKTEAEGEFRDGLSWLTKQLAPHPRLRHRSDMSKLALDWARYFEIQLLENLRSQGRLREAAQYQSIIPAALRPVPSDSPEAEVVGIGSLGGIATNLDLGTNSRVRLNDTEAVKRQQLMAQVQKAAKAMDKPGYYEAWKAVLDFDELRHGPAGEQIGYDLVRIAQAALDLGNHVEARTLGGRAETIAMKGEDTSNQLAAALSVQARALEAGGTAAAAEPLLRRALSLRYQDRNPWLKLDLAANLFAQGRLEESEAAYRDSLSISGLPPATREQVQIFAGFLALKQSAYARGMADYRTVCRASAEQAAQAARGSRATFTATHSDEALRDCAIRQALADWDWAQAGGGEASSDTPDALRDEAFMAAQLARSDPSAQALAKAGARAVASRSGVGAQLIEYDQAIAERDRLGAAPPEDWLNALYVPFPAEQQSRLDQLNARIAVLSGQLSTAAPRFWDLRFPQPLSIAAIRARSGPDANLLRPDETVISFMIPSDGRQGLVFAVSKDAAAWARLPFDRAELVSMINALRAQIDPRAYGLGAKSVDVGIGQRGFERSLAWKLYHGLFGDKAIQSVIAAKPNWIIVPSGPLTTLPPSLLLTAPPEAGTEGDFDTEALRRSPWLVRSKALTLLPSISSLRTVRQILAHERRVATDPLIALVDPSFSETAAASSVQASPTRAFATIFRDGLPDVAFLRTLPHLAHAKEEGTALKSVLGAATGSVLFGRAASKDALMTRNLSGALAHVRVIAFATHGFAAGQGDGAAEPMLVLSAAARPEDWVLRASDAAGLNLNAEWVILSGCNTASPDAGVADGLSGFARAFFFAGANSLLVSHWRLDDEIAARLVPSTFQYQRRHPGTSKAQALRHAMLDIIDDPKLDAAHPAFWAPFTLIGEPQ
ncbi:CHAT domain-containing protein [Aquisediminimonas profunda]|uniref:CHAT domain-containing protein n=1 Tax=Aquisediminimonas profunda TaxID=1550733 RepID=UPI001C6305C0|nr:CHAT domain-containing protein [Aquisediminimonas profunda]